MTTNFAKEQKLVKKTKEEIEKRTGKTTEQLFNEREKRVTDAINLREPDRVPVNLSMADFAIGYTGISPSATHYEPTVYKEAFFKTLLDFDPDICTGPGFTFLSGLGLETLDIKQMRWPGGNLPPDSSLQFLDQENMKPEEYDIFITDPTDFMLRYYLPRTLGALTPLSKVLPPLGQSLAGNVPGLFWMSPVFATKEFQAVTQKVARAGQEQAKFSVNWTEEMRDLGFPPLSYSGGVIASGTSQPFDWIADQLRGMKGIVEDMFKCPEKLLAACERVLEWRLARAMPANPNEEGYPRRVSGGVTHWSSDSFLSKKQFETFCWPTWKKSLLATIDLGFIPSVFCEGKCDDRLEYFLELPKGKVFVRFEHVDMARAKTMLGGHCCIGGNVPLALLQVGTPQEVEEHCRKLIETCGKGGGYILGTGAGLTRESKPQNVKALIDSAKKYGRY